jgi:hypothetical protein
MTYRNYKEMELGCQMMYSKQVSEKVCTEAERAFRKSPDVELESGDGVAYNYGSRTFKLLAWW